MVLLRVLWSSFRVLRFFRFEDVNGVVGVAMYCFYVREFLYPFSLAI